MADWSRQEVEAIVQDYFDMLAAQLAGVSYSKTAHRRNLIARLEGRTDPAIEYKHRNISAVLTELGFQSIDGYKPAYNYQTLILDVVGQLLPENGRLIEIAEASADQPTVAPEVENILSILREPPQITEEPRIASEAQPIPRVFAVNYLEREARNRSLGLAGEEFVINFEQERLSQLGKGNLASKIEHTSKLHGDGYGFDVLSFEESGKERLIEVKTTKYGGVTPFFVSKNELAVSEARKDQFHLYRLYQFQASPLLFILGGAISSNCALSAATYLATVRPGASRTSSQ